MELALRSVYTQITPQVERPLSFFQSMTEFTYRPWHCSTACVLRRLDARQSHAEGLPYREHFLVRILDLHYEQRWDMYRGTAYIRVSPWLYQHYDRCGLMAVRYRTSRHRTIEELMWGRGVQAHIAT